MLYFYYGEDSFRARDTIRKLKEKFIKLYDPSGANTDLIDQSDFTLERFYTAVRATGFLALKKFIVIKDIFSHKKFKDVQDEIISYLQTQDNTKDENYIVFWHEGRPRQNTKLFNYLVTVCSPLKCCREFDVPRAAELLRWMKQHALEFEKKLEPDAAQLLVSLVGDDTWILHNEIRKLAHASTESTISPELVEAVTSSRGADNIFPLVDAIGAKNKKRALALLDQALQAEYDYLHVLGMITRQFRLIIQTKELAHSTQNAYAIGQRLNLPPFVAQKIVRQSEHYSRGELTSIYRELQAIDLLIKSDPHIAGAALTLFVSRL